jgi:hypothetical protein
VTASVLSDRRTAAVSPKLQAALGMIEILTLHPHEIRSADVTLLCSLGASRTAVMDLTYICAGFNIINRIADALEVHLPPDGVYSRSSRLLYFFGYKFLAGISLNFAGRAHSHTDDDRFIEGFNRLEEAVTKGRGSLESSIRVAALYGGDLVQPLREYVRRVRESGNLIADDDIGSILSAGFSQDQLFELTVAAAVGAGLVRVQVGRRAVADSRRMQP